MFACDKCGGNHSYAFVPKPGVHQSGGRHAGSQLLKISPCSHACSLCCVSLYLTLTQTVREGQGKKILLELFEFLQKPLDFVSLLAPSAMENLLGLFVLCFIVADLRSNSLRRRANFEKGHCACILLATLDRTYYLGLSLLSETGSN